MTIQTVGRVGARCDDVDDRLCRAVVTCGTGTGAVGGNIMLGALDFGPVRDNVTAAARGSIRKITRTYFHSMSMRMAVEVVRRMTIAAIARCGARQLGP